jgi:exodeoxyribonuclease VII small subunit
MPTPSPIPSAPSPDSLTFEQAMAQLEAIVERVESGQIGLEQALAEYERGVALVKRCRDVLQRAELKVEELSALVTPSEQEPEPEDGR